MNRWRLNTFLRIVIGYGFLYIPIVTVIFFSFNESKLVTTWSRFSWQWYIALWENEAIFAALFNSIKIAALSATLAVALGTLAAIAMVRFGSFKGRTLFGGLISAPLIMPDVITGLAMLMMFISLEQWFGWPEHRGIMTISIAHITLAMAYVYLTIQARLQDFDRSIEEAALDLGARPTTVFFVITLPIIAPSLISGWLLAFALSFDDLVIASFLSGPSATTLPMLIFSSIRLGLDPQINALASLMVGFISIIVLFASIVIYRQYRNQK